MFTGRCIYNNELEDAIKLHGKIFVHTGPAGGSEPAVMTVDSVRQENAAPDSVHVDSVDHGSVSVASVSSKPIKSKPLLSVMADEARPDSTKTSKAVKPEMISIPPGVLQLSTQQWAWPLTAGVDAELPERGISCFLC